MNDFAPIHNGKSFSAYFGDLERMARKGGCEKLGRYWLAVFLAKLNCVVREIATKRQNSASRAKRDERSANCGV